MVKYTFNILELNFMKNDSIISFNDDDLSDQYSLPDPNNKSKYLDFDSQVFKDDRLTYLPSKIKNPFEDQNETQILQKLSITKNRGNAGLSLQTS